MYFGWIYTSACKFHCRNENKIKNNEVGDIAGDLIKKHIRITRGTNIKNLETYIKSHRVKQQSVTQVDGMK